MRRACTLGPCYPRLVTNTAPLPGKPIAGSITTMTELVLPTHANTLGTVFGGQVLAWIDLCAAICAQRHAGHQVTTAGIDDLSFERGVKVGEVVRVTACVTATFRTSIEIRVAVDGEDARSGEHWPCVRAFVTFVAIDDELRPVAVPQVILETAEQKRLAADAADRRARRLERRRSEEAIAAETAS